MPGKSDILEFELLGAVGVRAQGSVIRPVGSRQRGLLAYLMLHAGRSVRTEDLVAALWRDPPPTCRKMIQMAVSQLRRALGDAELLATEAYGYRLAVDRMAVDLHRFEALAANGRRELALGEFEAAAGLLAQALALWRGPALADLDEEPFVKTERNRLEALRLAATEDRIDAELGLAREHELIGELEQIVAADPLRERPRAQLMIALYRTGRQVEALEVYQDARAALVEQVGVEPGPALRELERAILRQDASLDSHVGLAPATVLPMPPNRLIGRERELEQTCATLSRDEVRLLTITGPGGVGKTRLALDAARELAPGFSHGVIFVPLDAVADPALVPSTLAAAVGARGALGPSIPALRARLDGGQTLLVLDSFEHLASAATFLAELLAAVPRLKLLVTSRASLRLSLEHELELGPLAVPAREDENLSRLAEAPAVVLFVERARVVSPALPLDRPNAVAVADICRLLDGLPLSIELAAARTRLLSPPALLGRLGRRLDLLAGGPLDAPARQRTLRKTIDWSLRLLSEHERALFAQLGVFVGGAELEAIEAVCGSEAPVFALLESLSSHSLVRRELGFQTRVAMLDTLREFALDLVEASGEADELRARHASWYLEWAERAEEELVGPEQTIWLRRLEADHGNLLAALAWFDQAGDGLRLLRLATALWHYWFTNGYIAEGRQWLLHALSVSGGAPPILRAKATRWAANFARFQLDAEAAEVLAAQALQIARETGDVQSLAGALSSAGNVSVWNGDLRRAHGIYEELLDLTTAAGFARGRANATINLGSLALLEGEPHRAMELCGQAVALASELEDDETKAVSLFNLGCAQLEAGNAESAASTFAASTRICLDGGFREQLAYCLVGIAAVVERRGDARRAGVLLGAADALLERMGSTLSPYERVLHARTTSDVRATLAGGADVAWAEGRQGPPEAALEAALAF